MDSTNPSFGDGWDRYAENARAAGQEWPGDDWGDELLWNTWFDRLFRPFGVSEWKTAIELGQGTGKYTTRALDAGCEKVIACDVSTQFLELCRSRHQARIDEGRLELVQISERDPEALQGVAKDRDLTGSCDAVFAIDAFVHLPLTIVANYMRAATQVLKPGGLFVFTFAEGSTEGGLKKMFDDADRTIRAGGNPETGCFHWVTASLVRSVAEHLGYEVEICDTDPFHQRDGHFVGRWPGAR